MEAGWLIAASAECAVLRTPDQRDAGILSGKSTAAPGGCRLLAQPPIRLEEMRRPLARYLEATRSEFAAPGHDPQLYRGTMHICQEACADRRPRVASAHDPTDSCHVLVACAGRGRPGNAHRTRSGPRHARENGRPRKIARRSRLG